VVVCFYGLMMLTTAHNLILTTRLCTNSAKWRALLNDRPHRLRSAARYRRK